MTDRSNNTSVFVTDMDNENSSRINTQRRTSVFVKDVMDHDQSKRRSSRILTLERPMNQSECNNKMSTLSLAKSTRMKRSTTVCV